MAFTCTDNLSGVAKLPDQQGPQRTTGPAQSVTSEPAEDMAGNTTPGKTVGGINIDGLAPQTTADNQCTKTNGWCTGSTANVVLTSTDQAGLSGVKEIRYSVNGGAEQVAAGATKTVSVPLDGSGNATVELLRRRQRRQRGARQHRRPEVRQHRADGHAHRHARAERGRVEQLAT